MVLRKLGSIVVAAALTLSLVGTAFAATVPEAVYSAKGEVRPATEVEASLVSHGVKDVTTEHWAAGSISVLLDAALLAPDAEGNLKPDEAVDFNTGAAVFAKVLGLASPLETPEAAAQKLVQAGLIPAREDGKLTRLDVALLLFTALGLEAKSDVTADTLGFTDAGDIPGWHWGKIAALKEAGVFAGFPDGTFQPNGELTLAQLATLIDRVLGAFAN